MIGFKLVKINSFYLFIIMRCMEISKKIIEKEMIIDS